MRQVRVTAKVVEYEDDGEIVNEMTVEAAGGGRYVDVAAAVVAAVNGAAREEAGTDG